MILLDTHVLVWVVAEPRQLSRAARAAVRRARASGGGLGVASITLWELAMLFQRGRLRASGTTEASVAMVLEGSQAVILDVTPAVAALAASYPDDFPRDPADRLIAGTAQAHGIPLVTRDVELRGSPLVRTIW